MNVKRAVGLVLMLLGGTSRTVSSRLRWADASVPVGVTLI
jgi:hypothetical protein